VNLTKILLTGIANSMSLLCPFAIYVNYSLFVLAALFTDVFFTSLTFMDALKFPIFIKKNFTSD